MNDYIVEMMSFKLLVMECRREVKSVGEFMFVVRKVDEK